jgi:hypothetical protein
MILLAVGLIKALMTNREKPRIPPRGPLAAGNVEAAGHTTFYYSYCFYWSVIIIAYRFELCRCWQRANNGTVATVHIHTEIEREIPFIFVASFFSGKLSAECVQISVVLYYTRRDLSD